MLSNDPVTLKWKSGFFTKAWKVFSVAIPMFPTSAPMLLFIIHRIPVILDFLIFLHTCCCHWIFILAVPSVYKAYPSHEAFSSFQYVFKYQMLRSFLSILWEHLLLPPYYMYLTRFCVFFSFNGKTGLGFWFF